MEQARLFLAIALSFLVFFVWEFFMVERETVQNPEKPPSHLEDAGEVAKEPGSAPEVAPYVKEGEPSAFSAESAYPSRGDEPAPRIITISSQKYTARISEKGGVFKSFVLRDYRERVEADSPPKEMVSPELPRGTLVTDFVGKSLPGLENAVFSAETESDTAQVYNQPRDISFSWQSPHGVTVEKIFHFSPDTYMIGFSVIIKNGSDRPIRDSLSIGLAGIVSDSGNSAYGFEGPSALINDTLEQIAPGDIEDKDVFRGKLGWTSVETRYFLSGLIPAKAAADAEMRLFTKDRLLENRYVNPVSDIQPGTQHRSEFSLFMGPKSLTVLKGLNNGLDKVVNFGWFDVIAKPCLWMMNFLHDIIPNYGVSIIILTVMIKLVLWPLGNKSYKSMGEMKKIQPLMAEIREKYKNDRKKMNEELMGLYKTYKINPMGGCLPMVLQIPVFIALYRMLYEAIELRHAPFVGWINDLSAPDRLLHFGFDVPFMDPPDGIPVLTIVMGATMFLQQKMSPPPGDPAQAKIMMLMPIMFTFIFINFSSGLVLYWLVNNVLSIAQQYYVSKK
ncbi:MAG: membrane protein insertase YidC [Desulfobacteraceae bacterium 4572_88]|nr:MAG: membrane protein insertase YidC [Desulfobacteraceae bacterium 4572_88]